ncbi:MAG: hypothetical protein U0793_08990 [Gemmataceae bacterium]
METAEAQTLRPFFDESRWSAADKKRSLGIAYFEAAQAEKDPGLASIYKSKASSLLSESYDLGLRDPALEARLARLYFQIDHIKALPLAQSVLSYKDKDGWDRSTALFIVGWERLKRREFKDARQALRDLVTVRRYPHDWLLLADACKGLDDRAGFDEAMRMARKIQPRLSLPR